MTTLTIQETTKLKSHYETVDQLVMDVASNYGDKIINFEDMMLGKMMDEVRNDEDMSYEEFKSYINK